MSEKYLPFMETFAFSLFGDEAENKKEVDRLNTYFARIGLKFTITKENILLICLDRETFDRSLEKCRKE